MKKQAKNTAPGAQCVADHTIHLAVSAGFWIWRLMSRSKQFLQMDSQKQRNVQHSMVNDVSPQGHADPLASEPHVFQMDGKVITIPVGRQGHKGILPSRRHNGRWAVRNMLWVRRNLDCEQVPMPSSDLAAALLRLPFRGPAGVAKRLLSQPNTPLLDPKK